MRIIDELPRRLLNYADLGAPTVRLSGTRSVQKRSNIMGNPELNEEQDEEPRPSRPKKGGKSKSDPPKEQEAKGEEAAKVEEEGKVEEEEKVEEEAKGSKRAKKGAADEPKKDQTRSKRATKKEEATAASSSIVDDDNDGDSMEKREGTKKRSKRGRKPKK